jgi:putative NADH-flavin reductase
MKVVLFGATGMVGAGVLRECLRDDRVAEVIAILRSSTGISHPKLREHQRNDFFDYSDARGSRQRCAAPGPRIPGRGGG